MRGQLILGGMVALGAILLGYGVAKGQSETDWARSRIQVGPGIAYALYDEPVITFSGGVQFFLWGVEPRPGFRQEFTRILQEKVTCMLLEGSMGLREWLPVTCRTASVPDVGAELIRRKVAYPNTDSGKPRKEKP